MNNGRVRKGGLERSVDAANEALAEEEPVAHPKDVPVQCAEPAAFAECNMPTCP